MRGVEGRLISEQAVTGSDIRWKMVYSIRESSYMYCNHTRSFSTRFQLFQELSTRKQWLLVTLRSVNNVMLWLHMQQKNVPSRVSPSE